MNHKKKNKAPKTKLRFKKLLAQNSLVKLAKIMNVTYTQLYRYKEEGANPTLLALEKLAAGLSELRGEAVTVVDLLQPRRPGRDP